MDFPLDEYAVGTGEWFKLELRAAQAAGPVRISLVMEHDGSDWDDPLQPARPDTCGYLYHRQQGMMLWGAHEGSAAQAGPMVVGQRNPDITAITWGDETAQASIETFDLGADRSRYVVVAAGVSSQERLDSASVRLLDGEGVRFRVVDSGTMDCRSGLASFDEGTVARVSNLAVAHDLAEEYTVPEDATFILWSSDYVDWRLQKDGEPAAEGSNLVAIQDMEAGAWRLSIPSLEPTDCMLLGRMVLHDYQQDDETLLISRPDCAPDVPSLP